MHAEAAAAGDTLEATHPGVGDEMLAKCYCKPGVAVVDIE